MPSVCVIQHVPFETPGVLLEVFRDKDCMIHSVEAPFIREASGNIRSSEILVVLGGPIGAYEESRYPFLLDELEWIEGHIAGGGIFLGICLGSQLLARVLGGRVYPGGRKEIGWSPLDLTAMGKTSPLSRLGSLPVLHWHGDTFDLPPRTTLLASTAVYPHQAYSLGKRVLGLQFHLEVTSRDLERWYVGHAAELAGEANLNISEFRNLGRKHAENLLPVSRAIFGDWLEEAMSNGSSKKPD